MTSVRGWLAETGLDAYADAFEKNGIDLALLPSLTNEDLRELGVERLADRKRMLERIRQLFVAKAEESIERRQISVLFCDLVGSTALSTEVDPEELRMVLREYQETVVRAVTLHGGFVASYSGDGVLAYFGWPYADEDQASQALRAGLEAVAAVAKLGFGGDHHAHCRVGIATGRVVVGGKSHLDSAFGETPNLAARLQGLAQQDQVVIDKATLNIVRNGFETRFVELAQLKGFDQPVEIWIVTKEREDVDRFEARHHKVSHFVGRDVEMQELLEHWRRAGTGVGQMVLVHGEAGIGKSRLVHEFIARAVAENPTIVRLQCSPYHVNSAFYPIIRRLEKAADVRGGEAPPQRKLERIAQLLDQSIADEPGGVDIIADLLGIEHASSPSDQLTSAHKRAAVIRMLAADIQRIARGTAMLLVIEDAHWIDPSTKELVDAIVEGTRALPAMILVTLRPMQKATFGQGSAGAALTLGRLGDADIGAIADGLLGPDATLSAGVGRIVALAEGIPLFAEEVSFTALEYQGRAKGFELPETLQASLTARLDLLGSAKQLAQVGAVIGREFGLAELSVLTGASPAALENDLGTLVATGLMLQLAGDGEARYRFRHALVRDAAYETLLKQERRSLHTRLAHEVLTRTGTAGEPEVIAHHLTEAGLVEEAIEHWMEAGTRAAAAWANKEAIAHFTMALELIGRMPDAPHHDALRFGVHVRLTGPLIASMGYTSEEFQDCFSRALALSQRIAYTPEIYPILYSRWAFLLTSGSIAEALKVALEFSDLAQRQNEPDALLARHRMLGASRMCLGELDRASEDLRCAIEQYDATRHARLAMSYGVDIRVAALCFEGEVLWLKGDVDRARDSVSLALEQAKGAKHLNSVSMSLFFCGLVSFLCRETAATRSYMDELMRLAEGHAIGAWPLLGRAMASWALLESGRAQEGLAAMADGIASARRMGVSMFMPIFVGRVAETLLADGRLAEAEQHIDDALALVARTGEINYLGELQRLKAEMHAQRSDHEAAAALFAEGLAIARSQNAGSIELRVATSWAGLLVRQGRSQAGLDLLQPIVLRLARNPGDHDIVAARATIEAAGRSADAASAPAGRVANEA